MKKKIQIIAILLLIIILISVTINLFTYKVKAISQYTDTNIEAIDSTKYPGIKEKINILKQEHPSWNFKILYTGIDWEEAIANEYTGHGSSPRNLVPASSSYKGDWICSFCGDKKYDSGSWKCASISAIKYMMDPRASLNSADIFQFLELSYGGDGSYSRDVVKQMTKGTFLDNDSYIDTIMNSCKTHNVNPYYIVARIIQEQGKNGSTLCKGQGYNGQYVGYYNVFNIGATGSGTANVILNGLKKAQSYGWTSMELSLDGGIKIIATSYIAVGQNTLYLQKFDVDNSDGKLYWHQYMQNVLAAQSEGTTLRNTIINIGLEHGYTFLIPVYENMPTETSQRPSTSTVLPEGDVELVKINVTGTLNMRKEPKKSAETVGSLSAGEVAVRLEKRNEKIDGTYWDKILKSNGTVGYVARCTYDNEAIYKEYIVHVSGTPNEIGSSSTQPETGNTATEVNKADLDKDGKIDSTDLLYVKKYLLGNLSFDDDQKSAADVNKDGAIDSTDLLYIKKYLLGQIKL